MKTTNILYRDPYPSFHLWRLFLSGQRESRDSTWRLYWQNGSGQQTRKFLEVTTGWFLPSLRYERGRFTIYPVFGAWFFYLSDHDDDRIGFERPSWGISFHAEGVHLHWGTRFKLAYWPWNWEWVRTSYLKTDGTWKTETKAKRGFPANSCLRSNHPFYLSSNDEELWRETYLYHYMLDSGEVQSVNATVSVEEREWRLRWATWFPFIRKVSRTIAVEFSGELGERAGSWKGGCTGCGYDMKWGETPRATLMRMQRERRFK